MTHHHSPRPTPVATISPAAGLARLARIATTALAAACTWPAAQAALIEAPLPASAYISFNGFEWAWGASCVLKNAPDCDTPSFSFQQSLGWRVAQASDMPIAPSALNFLFPGANVPFNGVDPVSGAAFGFLNAAYTSAESAGACASSYFTLGDGDNTCDWGNGGGQNVNTLGWFNQNGENRFFAEVLFVRAPVPEPSALAMLALGLGALAALRRRRPA